MTLLESTLAQIDRHIAYQARGVRLAQKDGDPHRMLRGVHERSISMMIGHAETLLSTDSFTHEERHAIVSFATAKLKLPNEAARQLARRLIAKFADKQAQAS